MLDSSTTSTYITWEELRILLDFGGFVHFHNVDETQYDKTDPTQIAQGFSADILKVREKLACEMKVLALPDGSQFYIDAAQKFPQIEFTRSSLSNELIRLKSCGGLFNKVTYGGEHTSNLSLKLDELAKQAAASDPYWVGLTVHRPNAEDMAMLTQVYNLYGKAGADNIWPASWDEVYEYEELRHNSTLQKSVEGQVVTFEITLPDRPHFVFHELSFLVDGIGVDCSVEPLSSNIYGLSHAVHQGKMLVNVNFDPTLLPRTEKYTAKYEASAKTTDRDDALYFASMLLPDLAAPFIARIGKETPEVPESGTISRDLIQTYLTKYDGHRVIVKKTIQH